MAALRILLAASVLAVLTAPASADAAQRGTQGHRTKAHTLVSPAQTPAPVRAAATAARRYWGATPCGGRIKYAAGSPLAPGLHRNTDAWVTFDSPLGANNLAAAAGSYRNCAISLARWRWPTSASMIEDWDLVCTTMIHEMGHLLGRPHDTKRGSVMAPVFGESSTAPSICRKARPRAAR